MKRSKAVPYQFDLECPYCSELLPNPKDGSFLFLTTEEVPNKLTCGDCGKTSKTPLRIYGVKLDVALF